MLVLRHAFSGYTSKTLIREKTNLPRAFSDLSRTISAIAYWYVSIHISNTAYDLHTAVDAAHGVVPRPFSSVPVFN
jgi:hypothetical protein